MKTYLPPKFKNFGDDLILYYPEEFKQKKARQITLQITEDCCMACTYCYQHNKTNKIMTFETAKVIIDKLLTNNLGEITTDNTFAILLDFIGGEPLMNISLIEQICSYYLTEAIKMEHPWLYHTRFSICSNGLLYDTPEVQQFFSIYEGFCGLAISLDGNKELHDSCRLDLQGNGTYDRIISSVHNYKNKYGKVPETKMTLAPNNIHFTKIALLNLIKEGYTTIPFNCVFEPGWTVEHAKILYNELKEISDYLISNNLYNKINIRMLSEDHFKPIPEEENTNWCGGVDINSISIDYKGDIFPCLRYMASSLNGKQKPLNVGNINTGLLITQEERDNFNLLSNITRRSQSTDKCFYCPIASGCSWCSGYNYEEFGTPNQRATHICIMHQAQALANVYYWNKLYKYLNLNQKFDMNIPKEWALEIIDEKEYNYLLSLIQ